VSQALEVFCVNLIPTSRLEVLGALEAAADLHLSAASTAASNEYESKASGSCTSTTPEAGIKAVIGESACARGNIVPSTEQAANKHRIDLFQIDFFIIILSLSASEFRRGHKVTHMTIAVNLIPQLFIHLLIN
jgi:hypothetical protein